MVPKKRDCSAPKILSAKAVRASNQAVSVSVLLSQKIFHHSLMDTSATQTLLVPLVTATVSPKSALSGLHKTAWVTAKIVQQSSSTWLSQAATESDSDALQTQIAVLTGIQECVFSVTMVIAKLRDKE